MGICSDDRRRKLNKNNLNKDIYNFNNNNKNNDSYNNNNIKDIIYDNDINNIKHEEMTFPKGEKYYQLIKGSNKSELIKKEDYSSEKVELFFSLTNVKNPNDEYSFGISIINNTQIEKINYLGKLENRKGKEIEFCNSFIVDFFFWKEQIVLIEPIINNNIIENKKEEFVLCKLMTRMDNKLSINFGNIGILEINYKIIEKENKELNDETSVFEFWITLNNNIFNKGLKEEYFFVIRNIKDGQKRPVYKSHNYYFIQNYKKKTFLISLDYNILCNSDDSPIFFELYSPFYNEAEFIGYCSFNIKQLKSNLNKDKFEKLEIRSKDNGNLGTLEIKYSCSKIISFKHFIKNGQINLDIAIDYTQSNGFPNDPNSLHYKEAKGGNDYEKVIKLFGKILSKYDYDQIFHAYGFGGIPPNSNKVSHCFNINFNDDNPEIETIENIIKYYRESLDKVKFYGPTYFAPIIKKVMKDIKEELENNIEENHYHILLMLTDGVIVDMKDTVDCIVEASKLPLSIIIVGIGNADFENLRIDDDHPPMVNSFGEIIKRDIVQFFEFTSFKERTLLVNNSIELTEEALKIIPRQIEEYYKFCGKFYEYSLDN